MKTDLGAIKDKAIQLIYTEPKAEEGFNVCQHPYISTPIIRSMDTNKSFNIFQDVEEYHRWQEQFKEDILHRKNAYSILSLIKPAYHMTFFRDINQYLSDKDFSELLAVCWASRGGREIAKSELEAWFKKANKKYLMDKREYKIFNELPEQVTVYRGVKSSQYKCGISWTLDKQTALWYADRYDSKEACVYGCIVDRKDILCYFDTRNEAEVIIAVSDLEKYNITGYPYST